MNAPAQVQTATVAANPRQLIDYYFSVFRDFEEKARGAWLRGAFEECAGYVQLAAQYAWFHPTGLLASFELEGLLCEISGRLPMPRPVDRPDRPSSPAKILHVVTEVYKVGGHTRGIYRWIKNDMGRRHSVVLTRQMEGEVPPPLRAAVSDAGGTISYLDRSPGGILARARALREMAADFDHIVVHAHPWDVVPSIAFLRMTNRPPITHMNKDDHVFFLGTTVADQFAQMRNSGSRLCQERRGIPPSRCKTLPLPLDPNLSTVTRAEAKRELGLPPDCVVLFSVASAYKYATCAEHFTDVLLPVVQRHPNVALLIVGPSDQGPWASARLQSGGRIRACGKLSKVDPYYRATDIYLDSFPFASLTSCLEAGSYGNPVVSYCNRSPDAGTLCADGPALSAVVVRGPTIDEYRQQVSRLIEDPALRAEIGERTRDTIEAVHTGEGWKAYLEALYANVPEPGQGDAALPVRRTVTELDMELTKTYTASGLSSDVKQVISDHVGMFPFKARVEFWAKEFGFGARALPTCLLSDAQKTRLRLLCSDLGTD